METLCSTGIESIKLIVGSVNNLKKPAEETPPMSIVADILSEDQRQVTLNLGDAVDVLRSLKQAKQTSLMGSMQSKGINAMVDPKVSALLACHNLGNPSGSSSHTRRSEPKKRVNGEKSVKVEEERELGMRGVPNSRSAMTVDNLVIATEKKSEHTECFLIGK